MSVPGVDPEGAALRAIAISVERLWPALARQELLGPHAEIATVSVPVSFIGFVRPRTAM